MRAHRWMLSCTCLVASLLLGGQLRADGPDDNLVERVRPVPPPGIELTQETRESLRTELAELEGEINGLIQRNDPFCNEYLPDVQVFASAVRMALDHNGFYDEDDVARARQLLFDGKSRARELAHDQATWNNATGLVVRGYVSRIDGSVQPYGMVVPETYSLSQGSRNRLDIWFHGRGEKLSEVNFLSERSRSAGEFAPPDTLVLHPYGRYCNANKFAGEIDTLEALEDVKRHYHVDDDRILVRGFSMGGAACWQFAVHYADQWCAAAPGAGFSETPDFLRVFQQEDVSGAPDYERRLWHWYDCTDYARNLLQCPTIAYSGELDVQKQAADVMATAMLKEGLTLRHIIGPGAKHSYHPQAKVEIEAALTDLAARGRERFPRRLQFDTYTLRYNRQAWLTVDALGEHWTRARVDAELESDVRINLNTENVTALTLAFPSGRCPLDPTSAVTVEIDGESLTAPVPLSDRSWTCQLHRESNAWKLGPAPDGETPRKRHGLQGPIDDAFMDAFLFVRPTRPFANEQIKNWTTQEVAHATEAWRKQFRGEAPIKNDVDVTDDDIANRNLVLWGDAESNALWARIAEQLPLRVADGNIHVNDRAYSTDHHVPILIAPNPLNPQRYVVLNSGVTFREYDYLNNARQVAKLPDWAIIDVRTPPNSRRPGKIVEAAFFDEKWRLRP